MHLSTSTRYAIRLLFELREPGSPRALAFLSEQTGISLKTAERIHAVLKQNGMTDAVTGSRGGIVLLVPLTSISLGQMIALFDDGVNFAVCYGDKANECPNQQKCPITSAWGRLSAMIQDGLDGISLGSILQEYPKNSCLFSSAPLLSSAQLLPYKEQ